MKTTRILDKLERVKKKFLSPSTPDTFDIIQGWDESIAVEILKGNLAEHDGMKPFLKQLERDVKEMENALKTADSKALPDSQRDRLLDRLNLYRQFVSYLSGSEARLRSLEAELDTQLKA